MDNISELVDHLAGHILTSMQASVLMSNILMSKLLGEGMVIHFDTVEEKERFVTMGVRPEGKAVIAILMDNVQKIYFLEVVFSEVASEMKKNMAVVDLPSIADCNNMWDNLMDEIYTWASGKKEKVEINIDEFRTEE